MAFFILKMFVCLKIYRVAEILLLCEDAADRSAAPLERVFKFPVLVQAEPKLCLMPAGDRYFFL